MYLPLRIELSYSLFQWCKYSNVTKNDVEFVLQLDQRLTYNSHSRDASDGSMPDEIPIVYRRMQTLPATYFRMYLLINCKAPV